MLTEQEKQIIEHGKKSGKSALEVKQALAKYRQQTGYQPPQAQEAPQEDSALGRVKGVIDQAGSNVADAIAGDGQYEGRSSIRRGFEATSEAFKAIPGSAIAATPAPVRSALGAVGKGIGSVFNKLTDVISDVPALQRWTQEHPDAAKALEEVAGTAKAAGEIAGTITIADQATKGLQAISNKVGTGKITGYDIANTTDDIAAAKARAVEISKLSKEKAIQATSDIRNKIQTKVGESSVDPQLQQSAQRLFLEKTADRVDDPVATYDQYLSQSKKALTDIKSDPAISVVGEKMGEAFKTVVTKRRQVGKTMETELQKVADVQTNVLPAQDAFVSELKNSGLVYDRVEKAIRQTAKQTAVTGDDVKLLESYASELQKLGSKPTIGELDSFISRVTGEVDLYKASKAITGTTNGERIIKGSLASLRKQFDPAVTGNPALAGYSAARAEYHTLSDFIDDGVQYLGKMTQSGDFAKDASIAKSAVQSILNNGKKDWMLKLEEMTGYKALDDSVLALQAMKDAGDFRGLSMLETLNQGSVPTSARGFLDRAIDFGLEKGKRAIAGTPEQQTRAYLQSLAPTSNVPQSINNHFTSAQQVLDAADNAKFAAMGGMPKLIERTQTNIVDGLANQMPDVANVVAQLNPQNYSSLEAFREAVMDALTSTK